MPPRRIVMLGLPRPEVINLSESEEMSHDMGGLNSETTWGSDQSGFINVQTWPSESEEPDEPMYVVDRAEPNKYHDEREDSMETEPEEDPEEDPEEELTDRNEEVQPVLGSEATQLPIAEPKSPVYIEISLDSAMSLERKDNLVPGETRIQMPPGPGNDFPLISANTSQPALGSIFDDSPGWPDYWRQYTGDMHQSEADKSW
ncbi:hypothetical protein AALP_AA6G119700 [Arabis alpina]|uniref:Uncharacterized protein n=1 Tax=Arabis alpina TaxID=50452 RepID=A0A087GNP2_ARAAL|nr:hypothetical protein AALP_AA6G119700 [Arabis alpina]